MIQSELEIKLIDYLKKKNIELVKDKYNLIWNYSLYFSQFKIGIVFENKNDKYIITFRCRNVIHKKKKTTVNKGFELRVYKILLLIKSELDKIAESQKIEKESKIKYCSELESYYKRKYKRVDISTIYDSISNYMSISVNCHESESYNSNSTYYSIYYKDGKYYLIYKIENFTKIISESLL